MSILHTLTSPLTAPLTSPLTARRGGGGSWLPTELFQSGEQGAWYDPSDMSTMFQDSAGTTPVTAVEQPVGRILDKSGRGNHATQPTAASKPKLSARVNRLTYSEDFTAAAWGKLAVTVVANSATASDGSVTADKLVPAATNTIHQVYANATGVTVAAGQRWTGSVDIKADGYGFCYVEMYSGGGNGFCLNLATGAITNASPGLIAGTVEDLGGGWWRANVTVDTAAASIYMQLYPRATAGGSAGWLGDGVNGVLMSRAQLTQSAAATTYQRVNTATSYDDVGFPFYELYDGVDDHVTHPAGGASTAFAIVMGVRPETVSVAQTLWSDRTGNAGLKLAITAAGNIELSGGNGSTIVTATGPVLAANTDYVVTAKYDGANLSVQLGNGAETTAACVLVAGTSTATIGKDNGAPSAPFKGRIYDTIHVKDSLPSDLTAAKEYVAGMMQVTL